METRMNYYAPICRGGTVRSTARCVLICSISAIGALWAADTAEQLLFNKARARALVTIERIPHVACVQTVNRSRYQLDFAGSPTLQTCTTAIAARDRNRNGRKLTWHDRLRVEVALGERSEVYSWAGATRFETRTPLDMIMDYPADSGEFGSFLASIFGSDGRDFVDTGLTDRPPFGRLEAFGFNVPRMSSQHRFLSATNGSAAIGYHGSFYVDPDSGELRELEIEALDFPASADVCRLTLRITYEPQRIGADAVMLPKTSTMDAVYSNSTESVNETSYAGCRDYPGNSPEAPRTADPKPIPPNLKLRVSIAPPLNSAIAAVGDSITGVVEAPVRDRGEIVIRVGDKLRGRIVRLEQKLGVPLPAGSGPSASPPRPPRWNVGLVFETIERNGVEQAIELRPLDDGDRSPLPAGSEDFQIIGGVAVPSPKARGGPLDTISLDRPNGGGIYSFIESGNLILNQKFKTEWETR